MKKIFAAVIALMMTLSASAQFYIYFSDGEIRPVDSISMIAPVQGALKGTFSVSETTQIRFSRGNLQYKASTNTWRFAENQYDIIGATNTNVSSTYNGWIDFYGWGTGSNPTLSPQLFEEVANFTDWGVNPISNGGNEANQWRTLTDDEWVYLINTRDDASSKYGVASVNGINGLVLLPDNWTLPTGCSFNSGKAANNGSQNFATKNSYTLAQWQKMESAGAVFLPAAGWRDKDKTVSEVGQTGYYWSSTPNGESFAFRLVFNAYLLNTHDLHGDRRRCISVRLVR